jgi:hypothetical protein
MQRQDFLKEVVPLIPDDARPDDGEPLARRPSKEQIKLARRDIRSTHHLACIDGSQVRGEELAG